MIQMGGHTDLPSFVSLRPVPAALDFLLLEPYDGKTKVEL